MQRAYHFYGTVSTMNRYVPYLGVVAALGVVVLIATGAGGVSEVDITQTASSSPSLPAVLTPLPAETQISPPVQVRDAELELSRAASTLREALVNIWCTASNGTTIRSVSGSGVFIDPKGYVLTNAHVAQYLLLEERGMSCVLRTGSPARESYRAELVYVSPTWIKDNARNIVEEAPVGTGEHDVAVLVATEPISQTSLPERFPFVPLSASAPGNNQPVAIVSYAAQYLNASEFERSLSPTIVLGRVQEIFTFGSNTADVLSFAGSIAAQEGASGGGVANAEGALVGTVTTSRLTGPTEARFLTAITAPYVRREYVGQSGNSLETLLATPPEGAIAHFAPVAAQLQKILEKVIDSE